MLKKKMWLGLGLMFAASGAYAQSYVMNFGTPLNSGAPAATVATLTLTQDGGDVDFSLTKVSGVSGLGGSSFISELSLTYSGSALLGSFGNTGSQAIGEFKVDPSGKNAGYDFAIQVKFPTSNGKNSDRFVDGDVASWTLTNANVSSFLSSIPGSGANAFGMVHVQGALGGSSFKYVVTQDGLISPVPEAQTWVSMLAGLGVIGLVFARRNKVGAQRSRLPSAA
ncbi:MAG: hypothetical protein HYX62_00420 [Gammaproteobacteria bacterium]|nr:hypothetical protein [Gammaproteobacteria bacterium]